MTGNEVSYRRRWAVFAGTLIFSVFVGVIAYNVGMSHGLAQGAVAQAGGAVAPYPYPYPYPYAYGWHRPSGFGFPFLLLFFAFWFLVFRRAWWGGPWRRHPYWRGPYGPYGVDFQPPQPPPAFDDWHRQAHERMKEPPRADDSGRGR
jgi:hypothetical protein